MSGPANHTENPATGQEVKHEKVRHYSVILCRGEYPAAIVAEDEYELAMRQIGIPDVHHVPLLQFKFENESTLLQELSDDDKFEGLILTSPRAVEAIARVAPMQLIDRWSRKQNFTVGPKTAVRAHVAGLTRKLHQEVPGNSRILALSIVKQLEERYSREIRFLMPCSCIARDELPDILREHGFTLTTVPAYDTKPAIDSHGRLSAAITTAASEKVLIVFFSPSNVNAVSQHLKTAKFEKEIFYVSIGQATSAALESSGMPAICTSALPTAESLAQTILSAITADS